MRASAVLSSALAVLVHTAAAVTGAADGFAKGVSGGGSAGPVYPKTNAELVSYLGDSQNRVIMLDRTFDFTGTEGTATETGCAPWGTGSGCQTAINKNDWCTREQASAPKVTVKYDKAGILGITVKSNKSLIGVGNKGVIKGKGIRMVSGVKNIIIQNVHITNLNPQYVWGGDAITLDNTDMIWIDHVTTSLIGRQHLVLGSNASGRVTVSNSKFDGQTSWSATCNTYHYWGMYFTGSNDVSDFLLPLLSPPAPSNTPTTSSKSSNTATPDDHLQEQLHLPHVRPLPQGRRQHAPPRRQQLLARQQGPLL
jgi:pectin lyase